MRTEIKTLQVFVTVDGKEFTSETEATDYEANLLEEQRRKDHIYYAQVYCSPDLTEGRGYQALYDVAVEGSDFIDPRYFFEQFMRVFTKPIEYVQGVSPTVGYVVQIVGEDVFLNDNNYTQVGSYKRYANKLFLSNKSLEGYPEPCPLNVTDRLVIESFIERNNKND